MNTKECLNVQPQITAEFYGSKDALSDFFGHLYNDVLSDEEKKSLPISGYILQTLIYELGHDRRGFEDFVTPINFGDRPLNENSLIMPASFLITQLAENIKTYCSSRDDAEDFDRPLKALSLIESKIGKQNINVQLKVTDVVNGRPEYKIKSIELITD